MAYDKSALLIATAAIVLLGTTSVCANGDGGGTNSYGIPSSEAERYDPTKDYRAGVAALQASKFDEADKAFTRVLRATPRDVNVLFMSGMAKAGKNDFKGASAAYERALRADAKHIMARREYALTLIKLGQKDKAAAELNTLKTRAGACADTCPEAADLKASVAAVEAALQPAGQSSSSLAPSLLFADARLGDRAYIDAVGEINEQRYREALESLHAAQVAFGPHPDVLTYLGFTYRKLGDYATAESYYKQALAIAPEHRGATEYYGELKVERGDLPGARQMLAKLDSICTFGCFEAEELRRWIDGAR
jgi:tetratricopeptide (TPR) repeat protein